MEMNAKEIVDFIIKNHKEGYENCISTVQSELLRAKIQGIAETDRRYERIDKEFTPIRFTPAQEKIEGCKCAITNQRCKCSST
jgi:succinate dehydrogenase/fumarate reductase flavoprotein subunit